MARSKNKSIRRDRATLGKLKASLHEFRAKLNAHANWKDKYLELVIDSDYLRIANTNQANRKEELAADALTLLLVGLGEFIQNESNVPQRLTRFANHATIAISQQLAFAAQVFVEPEFIQESSKVFQLLNRLVAKTGLDYGEQLLIGLDRSARKTIGLYFTPKNLASRLVDRTWNQLCKFFPEGQGDELQAEGFRVLDPAAGAGIFLLNWLERVKASSLPNDEKKDWFNRICGIELHPAIATLCHCRIQRWHELHFESSLPTTIQIHNSDALRLISESKDTAISRANIVLGNPPFGSLSNNTNDWTRQLLAGQIDGKSYAEVDGKSIEERKTWLHDDYVKFFRVAQRLVEILGYGAIAFVSNRSFLDNLTFRGMRWQLMEAFHVLEFEEFTQGDKYFDIATDVATSVMIKPKERLGEKRISYRRKNQATSLEPKPPQFYFVSTDPTPKIYSDSLPITEAFDLQGSTSITARDWFVIDIDREKLIRRIENFCDPAVSDAEIRQRYFQRCRSRRYVAGDTRSWKLSEAREALRNQDWQSAIQRCCYRPFDRRWILWTSEMIDWPRKRLMESLNRPSNMAIVTRRQFPSDQSANYFWVVNGITIDGIIRSDNRGNERVFPLYQLAEDGTLKFNLTEQVLELAASAWKNFHAIDLTPADLPRKVFSYIYGLFHAPAYREPFRQALSAGYPNVIFHRGEAETQSLIDIGAKLLRIHLPKDRLPDANHELPTDENPRRIEFDAAHHKVIAGVNEFEEIELKDWEHKVGTHQVLKKWLIDRRGHTLSHADCLNYQEIVHAVQATRKLIAVLRQAVPKIT